MKVVKSTESREHTGPIYCLSQGLENGKIVTGSGDRFVAQWNGNTLKQDQFAVKTSKAVYSVFCAHPYVYIGDAEGGLTIVDAQSGEELKNYNLHKRGVFRILQNPVTGHIYSLGGEGSLAVWQGIDFIRQIPLSEEKLRAMAISTDGERLFVSGNAGIVHELDTGLFNEVNTIAVGEVILSMSLHPSKSILLTGGKDARLRFHHLLQNLEVVRTIPAHNFGIYDIAFNERLNLCVTTSFDKTIKIWDSNTFESPIRLEHESGGHSSSVNSVLWQNEKTFITVGDDRRIIKWEVYEQD